MKLHGRQQTSRCHGALQNKKNTDQNDQKHLQALQYRTDQINIHPYFGGTVICKADFPALLHHLFLKVILIIIAPHHRNARHEIRNCLIQILQTGRIGQPPLLGFFRK